MAKSPGSEIWLGSVQPEDFTEAEYYRQVCLDLDFTAEELRLALSHQVTRVELFKTRPLLWALFYMRDAFVLQSGPYAGQVTMSEFSLDFFAHLYDWSRPNELPGEKRYLLAAPREQGKSILMGQILPAYTLATSGVKEFITVFTASQTKARERIGSLRKLIDLISEDYPALQPSKKGAVRESDSMFRFKMNNGSILQATGITSSSIAGSLEGYLRPSLSILDDISPSGGEWSPLEDANRLKTIREVVLELGKMSRVFWVGTTVAYGSLVHEALLASADHNKEHWSYRDKWQVHHHLPIITTMDEDGNVIEKSSWEKRYPLTWLLAEQIRDDRLFALNYMNMPLSAADGSWFTPELFNVDPMQTNSYRVISVDPAISTKPKADPAGVAVVSFSQSLRRAQVDEVLEVHAKSIEMKRLVLMLLTKYPDIKTFVYEATQGGTELFYATYGMDFEATTGVRVVFTYPKASKLERAEVLLSRYKKNQIVHAQRFPEYERELLSFPYYSRSPNQTDAVSQAVEHLAHMTPERTPRRDQYASPFMTNPIGLRRLS